MKRFPYLYDLPATSFYCFSQFLTILPSHFGHTEYASLQMLVVLDMLISCVAFEKYFLMSIYGASYRVPGLSVPTERPACLPGSVLEPSISFGVSLNLKKRSSFLLSLVLVIWMKSYSSTLIFLTDFFP